MPSRFHSGVYKAVPFHGYGLALLTSHLPAVCRTCKLFGILIKTCYLSSYESQLIYDVVIYLSLLLVKIYMRLQIPMGN